MNFNLFSAQTKIEIVIQGTYGFLHDVYSKQLYSMKGYRYFYFVYTVLSVHVQHKAHACG